MTCLKALREAARVEPNMRVQQQLRWAADDLEDAIDYFRDHPDTETLVTLNGRWSVAAKVLKLATPTVTPPSPTSTVLDGEKIRIAA